MSDEEFHDMKEDVQKMKHKLEGNGSFGVLQKVDVMWRVHVWLLCGFSTIVGAIIASLFNRFFINK